VIPTTRQVLGRPVVQAVLVALLVSTVTWLIAIQRPAEYEARVYLLASPSGGGGSATLNHFPEVARQSLAAIVDVAHSPSVLANASGAAEGAPTPTELSASVLVDVIPASFLTRLSVRASTPEVARQLVHTIAAEVIAKDLISPVGKLRLLDDQPSVARVAPDESLAAGLALAAGAATAAAVLVLNALVRPSNRQQVRRAIAAAGIDRPVALVDCNHSSAIAELQLLAAASGRPVRVVALTLSSTSDAASLSSALTSAGVPVANDQSGQEVSIVGVASEFIVEWLSSAIAALPNDAQLIAVALSVSRRKRKSDEAGH
jgi:capsular polysaccharide biosynthesis protein